MGFISKGLKSISGNKLTSIVSILGLSVGLTITIYLVIFMKNEFGYDHFHLKHNRIYRVLGKSVKVGQEPEYIALCQGGLPSYLNSIPEIESSLRVLSQSYVDLEYDNKRITNNHLLFADTTFFNLFSYKILSGNAFETMKAPNGLIICKSLAIKVFNSLDIIGRSVKVNGKDMTIGSILDDIPINSHLQFNMLHGPNDNNFDMLVKHSGGEFYTYILLRENVDIAKTLDKAGKAYSKLAAVYWADSDIKIEGLVQPLNDIELHSDKVVWDVPHGNIQNIYIAGVLIIFILIIAILNIVNLLTVNAEAHVKEIGIRKASGASRFDLIRKYMGETELIAFLSLLIATFLVWILWPLFNSFTGKNIDFKELLDFKLIISLIILTFIIGAISGIYPAFYLSRFPVIRIFKGAYSKRRKLSPLVKGMVVSQFFIVISLVSCLLIFYSQMSYVKNKNLGFNKEFVVGINGLTGKTLKSYGAIREKLFQKEGITDVCLAQGISDNEMSGQYMKLAEDNSREGIITKHTRTSEGFIKIFGIEISEGRDFDKSYSSDKKNFIINEAAVKAMGFEGSPVGKKIIMQDTGIVIGVVKDFNFASLHNKVAPLVITFNEMRWGTIYIKMKPSFIKEGLEYITQTVKSIDPLYTLEYDFIDDNFNKMYQQEEKLSKMLFTSAMISILLALMGLIALTSFTILRRVKEIGIRKVNGATIFELLILMNREFTLWVGIAFLSAIPVSWIIMHKWLEGFAFKAGIKWWIYGYSGFSVLISSFIVISAICWRTATRNPVEALRYE